jgi:hypothetical protein
MKPAKISVGGAAEVDREGGDQQTQGAPDKAENLKSDPADLVGEDHRKQDADDQQNGDHRRSLGGQDRVGDQIAQAADVVGLAAERGCKDGWRKDADAVGAEILEKPWHRGKDRRAPVAVIEQRHERLIAAPFRVFAGGVMRQRDVVRVSWAANEESIEGFFGRLEFAAHHERVSAFDDEETGDRDSQGGDQGSREHPAPSCQRR